MRAIDAAEGRGYNQQIKATLRRVPASHRSGVYVESFSWLSGQGAKMLLEHLRDGVYAIENEKIAYANDALAELLGCPVAELIGRPFLELLAPEDVEMVLSRHRDRVAGRVVPENYFIRLLTAQGERISCELHAGITVDREGRTVTVGSVRDVSDRTQVQQQLRAANEELRRIYEQLPDIYYRVDMAGIIAMASPASRAILGYAPEEMVGKPMVDLYKNPVDRKRVVAEIVSGAGKPVQVEMEMVRKDGRPVWILAHTFLRYDEGGQPRWLEGTARDITTRKEMEEQLANLVRTDSLTGLYSRSYFMEQSEEIIRLMKRHHRPMSVMIADLDHFKRINDTYGHLGGDRVLVTFAETCRKVIRESDLLGRLGGEEFGLVLPETPLQQARVLAERLREATAEAITMLEGRQISLTVSIGLVEMTQNEYSISTLLRRADHALYQAKDAGRNQVFAA